MGVRKRERVGGREGGREGGWEGGRVGGREGGRERGRGGREGGREGGWEGRLLITLNLLHSHSLDKNVTLTHSVMNAVRTHKGRSSITLCKVLLILERSIHPTACPMLLTVTYTTMRIVCV